MTDIIIRFDPNIVNLDYVATRSDYEPGDCIGRGKDEVEALKDLLYQEDEKL